MSHSPPAVSRTARLLDLASLACVGAGGAAYARAYHAMRVLEGGGLVPHAASGSGIAQFNHYAALADVGLTVAALGVAAAVGAAVVGRRPAVGATR